MDSHVAETEAVACLIKAKESVETAFGYIQQLQGYVETLVRNAEKVKQRRAQEIEEHKDLVAFGDKILYEIKWIQDHINPPPDEHNRAMKEAALREQARKAEVLNGVADFVKLLQQRGAKRTWDEGEAADSNKRRMTGMQGGIGGPIEGGESTGQWDMRAPGGELEEGECVEGERNTLDWVAMNWNLHGWPYHG